MPACTEGYRVGRLVSRPRLGKTTGLGSGIRRREWCNPRIGVGMFRRCAACGPAYVVELRSTLEPTCS
jgi:hypothetical protein